MRALMRGLARVAATTVAVGATVVVGGAAYAAPPTSAPTITSGPASGSSTNQTSATFTFTHTDPTATFTCQLDRAKAKACTSPMTYTGLKVGSHTFSVRAQVPGRKASKATTRTWTVDLTAPNAPTVSQPASPSNNTSPSITFSSSSTDVQSYLCSLDGAVASACTSPKALSGLTHGYHTFTVKAVDKAGNQSTATTVQWAVDIEVDAPFITSAPPSVSTSTVSFAFDNSDPNVTYTCSMDSSTAGSFTPCTSPKSYTSADLTSSVPGVSHTFRVKAIDAVGNVSAPAAYTWTVKNSPPITLSWSGDLPNPVTSKTTATFAFTATGQTTLSCSLDSSTPAACSSPVVLSDLTDGSHTFTVIADDGLASEVSFGYTWMVDTAPASATFTWQKVKDKKAKGKSYLVEHRKGATASWSFKGKAVTWYTLTGPKQGKATLYVDGVRKATVNNYSRSVKHVGRVVKGLSKGKHTLQVRVLGQKGSKKGKGTFVAIDGFKVGKKVTPTPSLSGVAWSTVSNAQASGGKYAVADLKGQTMTATFHGTGVTVTSATGPAFGKAQVYVDGTLVQSLDLYATSLSFTDISLSGFTDDVHTLVVKVLGSKNASSTGTGVVVDGVRTGG